MEAGYVDVRFKSANAAPLPVFAELVGRFPDLKFPFSWIDLDPRTIRSIGETSCGPAFLNNRLFQAYAGGLLLSRVPQPQRDVIISSMETENKWGQRRTSPTWTTIYR